MKGSDQLRDLARSLAGPHYDCEDSWYSCPLSEDGCSNEFQGTECTCGVESGCEKIFQALTSLKRDTLEWAVSEVERYSLVFTSLDPRCGEELRRIAESFRAQI